MVAVTIWKIEKLQYICFADRPVLRKFGIVMCLVPPNRVSIYNFMLLKIQRGRQLPSGKYKKHDISKIIWTYFSRTLV